MKRVRLIRIYDYYLGSAKEILEEVVIIKKSYLDGEISYKRAFVRLNKLLALSFQRLALCEKICHILNAENFEQTKAHALQIDARMLYNFVNQDI